ncbi:hypothetical protein [Streptomyces sp. NPDC018059]|uniref:hypothetical protein n=1 Tax=Streptomyces sp. NPDC018059 TaxID=3365041 RepID=UPI0037A3D1D3
MSGRTTASITVTTPSVQGMNDGGAMPRRSSHGTVSPARASGTPKLPSLSQYALLAALIAEKSSCHNRRALLDATCRSIWPCATGRAGTRRSPSGRAGWATGACGRPEVMTRAADLILGL